MAKPVKLPRVTIPCYLCGTGKLIFEIETIENYEFDEDDKVEPDFYMPFLVDQTCLCSFDNDDQDALNNDALKAFEESKKVI